jgi:uncharacterized membrane protein
LFSWYFFSEISLLLLRKATDFSIVLCSTTLLKVFINDKSFLVDSVFCFCYFFSVLKPYHMQIDLIKHFSCLILYIPFSWFIALRTQALYWIRVERMDTLVLFMILEEMISIFPHLEEFCYGLVLLLLSADLWTWTDAVLCKRLFLFLHYMG